MRIRTALPAALAAAVAAATLAFPATAAQADSAPPTAPPSASATASPTTPAASPADTTAPTDTPSATPSDSGSPSTPPTGDPTQSPTDTPTPTPSDSTPTATGPDISDVTTVDLDWGLAIQAHVVSATGVSQVTATVAGAAEDPNYPTATVVLSLVSGSDTDGIWQTTAPVGLTYDRYTDTTLDAVDTGGTHAFSQPFTVDYAPTPIFNNVTFSQTHLSYGNETVTATGVADLYDPASGPTTEPYRAVPDGSFPVTMTWSKGSTIGWVDYNTGQFTVSAAPGPIGSDTFTLSTDGWYVQTDGPSATVTTDPASPTRIILDRTQLNGYTAGSTYSLSGTAQYQNASGTWVPLAYSTVDLGSSTNPQATASTGPTGRFSFAETLPSVGGSWTVYTPTAGQGADQFLAGSSATFSYTSPVQKINISIGGASINSYSQLSFSGSWNSTTGQVPGNRIYVFQSANGKTGWTELGWISGNYGNVFINNAYVTNPHGYWKLYSPAIDGYASVSSNIIHTFRYGTTITGGRPSATTVWKNQTVRFSGSLWQQGYGSWGPFARAQILVIFKPAGSSDWYLMATTTTNAKGAFSANAKVPQAGTWMTEYYYADAWHVVAGGPQTYIHTR